MKAFRIVLLLTMACFSFKAFGKDTGNTLILAIYQIPQSFIGWLSANSDSYNSGMTLNYIKKVYASQTRYWTSVASDYHTGNVTFHDKDNHVILLSDAFGTLGGDAHSISAPTSGRVEAITIDWLSQNVYWVDEGYNWIKVTTYFKGGPDITIVGTGLERPSGIACHPIKGYLFWTELGNKYPPKIERSSMSGANRTTIVTGLSEPRSIAVDINTNRIYWTDNRAADIKIESSDLNGNNRRTEVSQPASGGVFDSISVDEDNIFVSVVNPTMKHIIRYYDKSNPSRVVFQHTFSSEIRLLDVYVNGPNIQPKPKTLPCNLHTCSHLCVSADNGKHECICKDNYVLFPNGTCSIDSTKWYPPGCIIGSTDAISMFYPNVIHSSLDDKQQFIKRVLRKKIITAVTVDIYSNLLFFAEDTTKSISVIRIEKGTYPRIIHTYTGGRVDGMAVDWISLNVYWVDYLKNLLMVSSYDGIAQSTRFFNVIRPRAIAVDPNARIYIVGEDSTLIYTIDYDGIENVDVIGSSISPAKDITLYQDFIILAGSYERQSGFIEAIHKVSGSHEGRINVNTTVYAIETFDESAQPIATLTTTPEITTTSPLTTRRIVQTTGSKFTLIIGCASGAFALIVVVVVITLLGKRHKRKHQDMTVAFGNLQE
ncbi:low-density lipoprotein receptor-related protein 5-like [Anneissia japonica]|uniref:low-density lipoprotein receptor-related protein 5-like n=1 Tax=Anneissia japonica TaxID=1529436 RepID=UPI0014256BBC|nr:low-density lipoprotein receptor-related protein 5-like [Anneissia japonica]